MADKPVPLTPEGHEKLQKELDFLVSVKRPEVAEAIHSAKEEGDISDNSAYDAVNPLQTARIKKSGHTAACPPIGH